MFKSILYLTRLNATPKILIKRNLQQHL